MGFRPGRATLQAAETLRVAGFQDAPPLEPRPPAQDQRLETAHNRMIRAEHRDPRREKHEPRHDRQQGADHAQDQ